MHKAILLTVAVTLMSLYVILQGVSFKCKVSPVTEVADTRQPAMQVDLAN